MLFKAHRVHSVKDGYKLLGPILETLTRDAESLRVREIRANEDAVKSIFDEIHSGDTVFQFFNERRQPIEKLPDLFYNEVDALEEKILFAEEEVGSGLGLLAGDHTNKLNMLEVEGPSIERFVYDLDTDEEAPEEDDFEYTSGDSGDSSDEWEDDEDEDEDEDDDEFDGENSEEKKPMSEELQAFVDYISKHSMSKRDPNANMEEQFEQFVRREASRGMPRKHSTHS